MISLVLYKDGIISYGNSVASIPINFVGYGRMDFFKVLTSEIDSFNENKDVLGIFKLLDGKLSKGNTGRLIYYLSTYSNMTLKVQGW